MKTVKTLLLAFLLLALPAVVQAQFTFITNADNTITITGYTGPGGMVVIPSATNGYPVTSIGNFSFNFCDLTSVTIPDSVTNIGEMAFYTCEDLTSVAIPAANIGPQAFMQCSKLTSVTIGNSVGNSATSIGEDAFSACDSLTNVVIGNSVTSISNGAFFVCYSLTAINVDAQNPAYSSLTGVLFNKNQTTLIQYPYGIAGSYTLPNSVTNIGEGAFAVVPNLTGVTIPNGVTSIGASAFEGCSSLTGVFFEGNAPTNVGSGAFSTYAKTTVYYLPGTTGWGSTFAGLPTALWQPRINVGGAGLGVQANQFGLIINWASGQTVVVEACTNLANPIWSPVGTNTLTSGSSYFSDPVWTNYSGRFYRLRSP